MTEHTNTPAPRKRARKIVAGTAVLVVGGGAAFAYWSAGGSGTGTAATGTTVPLTVNQTALANDLEPGVAAQTLEGTFGNTNDGPIYVTSVVASISSVTPVGANVCDATNYTLTNATMTVGANVAVGDPVGSWSGATIAFNNTAENQDGCKGATVNLSYAVN